MAITRPMRSGPRKELRGFMPIAPMIGPNCALRRTGKTAADKARRQNSWLHGTRAEVLAKQKSGLGVFRGIIPRPL